MKNPFTIHPHSVGESYIEHFQFAAIFGFKLMIGGLACLVHSLFPFLCQKTASNLLLSVLKQFLSRIPSPDRKLKIQALMDELDNVKS